MPYRMARRRYAASRAAHGNKPASRRTVCLFTGTIAVLGLLVGSLGVFMVGTIAFLFALVVR